ncbi:hypothetical protein LPJ70_006975, partial [Coemansia sp. RSA 2708]
MVYSTAFIAAAIAALALTTSANPMPHLARRWGFNGCGCGIGFPFASSFTNAFNANNNFANFNDDTLFVNNKDATTANNN